jgi:ribose-phosphate pyrophosphokinase
MSVRIFAGNSNPELAREICAYVGTCRWAVRVWVASATARSGSRSTSPSGAPTSTSSRAPARRSTTTSWSCSSWLDALKRASAGSISAVIPYFGYARQDRKAAPRAPISARLVTDLLSAAAPSACMTMELHAGQIQGFFNGPVDHLYSSPGDAALR